MQSTGQQNLWLQKTGLLLCAAWLLAALGLCAFGASKSDDWLVATISLYIIAGIPWITSVWLAGKIPWSARWETLVIVVAVLLRFLAIFIPPQLSDDLRRYRWEGEAQARGLNPYQVSPREDGATDRLPVPEARAIYGPVIMLAEASAWKLTSSLSGMRLPAMLAELCICGLLLLLRRRCQLPPHHALIWLWAPLPLFEFWANGHNDAITLALLLAAVAFSGPLSMLLLGLAAATKYWPLLLLPFFRRQWKLWWIVPLAFLATWAPYGVPPLDNFRYTSGFLGGWRNNDFLFAFTWLAAGEEPYRAKYLSMALIATGLFWIWRRNLPLVRSLTAAVATLLLLSANIHPWYASWPLLFAALYAPQPAALLWFALLPLCYEPMLLWQAAGLWQPFDAERWFIHLPPLLLLADKFRRECLKPVHTTGAN
jgi:alpha-1,6-mannosyltransferase